MDEQTGAEVSQDGEVEPWIIRLEAEQELLSILALTWSAACQSDKPSAYCNTDTSVSAPGAPLRGYQEGNGGNAARSKRAVNSGAPPTTRGSNDTMASKGGCVQ
ncbi:hypothetical protein [Streptomyces sp. NPDC005548]|uniref:hypothetical protein n=1 Tax=Streptomyces sp. NPDC005548 TaxID=3364724 RepID=UPI003679EED6